MESSFLIGAMAFTTLLGVAGFAWASKRKTDARIDDLSAPKSTLAKDKSSHGKPADV